jgi:hypothetical protein
VYAILAQRALDLLLAADGDYNGNGVVDAADYTIWRETLEQTGAGLAADGNGTLTPAVGRFYNSGFGKFRRSVPDGG